MGEFAALITAFLWAATSIFFTRAGKMIGAQSLNRLRLSLAVILLLITHTISQKTLIPIQAEGYRWMWLGLSGIIGLVIGDLFLFQAFIYVGHRIAMLIMSTVPAISALFAWLFLGETLGIWQIIGIALTMTGIMLVVFERRNGKAGNSAEDKNQLLGILFSFGGAIGQATGLIFAKKGLVGSFPALSGVLIRMLVAAAAVWLVALFTKQVKRTFTQLRDNPSAIKYISAGASTGPFLGVWFSLIAVQFTKVGIASTLMALTPIFHLPIGKYLLKETIQLRAVLGTIIAMLGVALIFMHP